MSGVAWRAWMIVAATMLGGCLRVASVSCDGGGVCPAGLRCGMAGDRLVCVSALCGNGRIDPGEACDDGNNVSADGCPASCGQACGDGVLDPGEACDGDAGGVRCSSNCRSIEGCGNGVTEPGELCDDGNLQSQDGCSSRCSHEAPTWTAIGAEPAAAASAIAYDAARGTVVLFGAPTNTWEWDGVGWQHRQPMTVPPTPASTVAMFYDSTRQRVVMFSDFSSTRRSWWEWDSRNWSERAAAVTPPLLLSYAIAYDTARQHAVLFGGGISTADNKPAVTDRTWEWDGVTWHEIPTTVNPPGRAAAAMAYDARRGVMVMYGGADTETSFYDTWEYDGASWILRATSGPPRPFYARLVYDATRERVVLFGGLGADDVDPSIAYTWEWDGAQWTAATGSEPPARLAAPVTYDVVRREIVVFGGQLRSDVFSPSLNDTWTRSGPTWVERSTAAQQAPSPRSHHAMAYERRRTTTVLFGGQDAGAACLDDTWLWTSAGWRRPLLIGPPPPRADHAMAYDPGRDRSVLFGGADCAGKPLDDTWEWDGAVWRAQAPAVSPPARAGHAMVYDPARQQVLLFGGAAPDGVLSDQWAWDGERWAEITPVARPPGRSRFAAAADPARNRIVVFGGLGASGVLGDLWEWDGERWADRTPATAFAPAARFGHSLIYDAALRRIFLFGGHGDAGRLNDAWTWDGERWAPLSPAVMPKPRRHHAMVSDAARRALVMFGGEDSAGVLGDTWLFRHADPAVHLEVCDTGFDGDGDGEVGCADPDCSELCASCGDGVCEAFESCRLCPTDCGACRVCGDLHCDAVESCASCPGDCGACP